MGKEVLTMSAETIAIHGEELLVLQAPPNVAFAIEEAGGDRITIRLVPRAMADISPSTTLVVMGVPHEVIEFADRLGILDNLNTATAVARSCFPAALKWMFFAHKEPSQVEINVTVQGTPEDTYRRHAACLDRWIKLFPSEALGKLVLTETIA
jgi:hypothetical protein